MTGAAELLALAFAVSAGVTHVNDAALEPVYGKPVSQALWAWVAVRPRPYVAVGLEGSYSWRKGTPVDVDTLEPLEAETRWKMGTVGIRLEGRMEMRPTQVVVPYLVGGPLFTWWRENVDGQSRHGGKWGAMVGFGTSIQLYGEARASAVTGAGQETVQLNMEVGHRWARLAADQGLDLGGWYAHGGVEVLLR